MFYQRVFGTLEPHSPQGEDATRLVSYNSKVVRSGQLYKYLMEEINDIVVYMTSPTDHAVRLKAKSLVGVLDKQHHRVGPTLERDTPHDSPDKATELGKSQISDHRKRTRPLYSLAQEQIKAQRNVEERHQVTQQHQHVTKSVGPAFTQSPNHLSVVKSNNCNAQEIQETTQQASGHVAKTDDKACSFFTLGDQTRLPRLYDPALADNLGLNSINTSTSTPDSQYRLQSCFGDPATADFDPTPRCHKRITRDHEAAPSSHGMLNHDGPHVRTSSSARRSQSKAIHQSGNRVPARYPVDVQSTLLSNTSAAPLRETVPQMFKEVGCNSNPYAIAPDMPPLPAGFQDEHDTTAPGHLLFDRSGPANRHRRKSRSSSHESTVERPLFSPPFRFPIPEDAPRDDFIDHTQSVFEAQDRVQENPETRSRYQAYQINRAQSHQSAHQPFPFPGTIHRNPGLHFNAINTGYVPTHPTAAPFRTFGSPGQLYFTNSHQQQPQQPLPQYETFQPDVYGKMQGQYTPRNGFHAGQPIQYALNAGVHTNFSHGAIHGPTSHSYIQPYIPTDKYARAPAPNRLASRFTQTSNFQPLQSAVALPKSGPQTRFPTPIPSPRVSLTTLPYRSGSDDMFPYQRPGVASIRYQDLTREEPPRFGIAGDEDYMPFIETPNLAKPAEWGVLKVSNVSVNKKKGDLKLY